MKWLYSSGVCVPHAQRTSSCKFEHMLNPLRWERLFDCRCSTLSLGHRCRSRSSKLLIRLNPNSSTSKAHMNTPLDEATAGLLARSRAACTPPPPPPAAFRSLAGEQPSMRLWLSLRDGGAGMEDGGWRMGVQGVKGCRE